ncbi:MAG TPA: IS110 family transposase [Candidatus Acidoferrales bacterium]|nr:IS110 family transposase [Candidatus Acidoferrales bacterium]
MVETDYRIYVGIDWGSEVHQACVLDHERRIVAERSFAHAGDAVAGFAQWLRELADDPGRVAIAIEILRGAIVETLVERGFHVYAINPKQLDRFRDRYCMSGVKDERRDAFVLADSLRTDQPCFRRVRLDDPRVIQLRELSRVDEELQREGNQLANRLREQLRRFYVRPLSSVRRPTSSGYGRCSSLRHRPALRGACDRSVSSACCTRTAFGASARKKSFPHSRRRP